MKKISILGSTGSIGTQCLDVVRDHPEEYKVVALTCGKNVDLFCKQLTEFEPALAVVTDEEAAERLTQLMQMHASLNVRILVGKEALKEAASCDCNMVVNAITGIAGLAPTVAAIETGNDIALANKETLVAGGQVVMPLAKQKGVRILPVDSEHSAIFQCIEGHEARKDQIRKLILTASGGPFRNYSMEAMERATVQQALRHPNWNMGAKISVDSATMMNKGLEFIEAMWLFDKKPEDIEIVVHKQSIVHSMIEFQDGSVLAQMGPADMRLPIGYAMSWPDRSENSFEKLDFSQAMTLSFEKPDISKYRCLKVAIDCAYRGGSFPVAMNAANEQLVALALDGKIRFAEIARKLESLMSDYESTKVDTVEEILAEDEAMRERVRIACGVNE